VTLRTFSSHNRRNSSNCKTARCMRTYDWKTRAALAFSSNYWNFCFAYQDLTKAWRMVALPSHMDFCFSASLSIAMSRMKTLECPIAHKWSLFMNSPRKVRTPSLVCGWSPRQTKKRSRNRSKVIRFENPALRRATVSRTLLQESWFKHLGESNIRGRLCSFGL